MSFIQFYRRTAQVVLFVAVTLENWGMKQVPGAKRPIVFSDLPPNDDGDDDDDDDDDEDDNDDDDDGDDNDDDDDDDDD